jgi:hypothetical protein
MTSIKDITDGFNRYCLRYGPVLTAKGKRGFLAVNALAS